MGAGYARVPDEPHQLHVDVALEGIGGAGIGLQRLPSPHGLGDVHLGWRAREALSHDVAEHARARGGPAVAGAGDGVVHAGGAEAPYARLAPLGRALDDIDHHHGLASQFLGVLRGQAVA